MAAPSGQIKPSRYFIPLGLLLIVLYTAVMWPGHSSVPKLGLDLQGGTSLTLSANAVAGGAPVNAENLGIARDIIEQRVDSLGVAESDVVVQGNNIVVNVPGKVTDQDKLKQLSNQAKLEFRTVVEHDPGRAGVDIRADSVTVGQWQRRADPEPVVDRTRR